VRRPAPDTRSRRTTSEPACPADTTRKADRTVGAAATGPLVADALDDPEDPKAGIVTGDVAADAGPVPAPLRAVTVKVYVAPGVSPVTWQDSAGADGSVAVAVHDFAGSSTAVTV
jgi:hypothetical protein